ncbi:hypothetical protein RAS2_29180 [Phycisphaerae bacterium RAS2]|nr:hypothetical protein RAS2_29180 [Phycisphaerae bacterium RAS2]
MATANSDNPVAQILESVPELTLLESSRKSVANEFLERRLGFLAQGIRSSPYEPYRRGDKLRINSDFPAGLGRWLRQFPDGQRLGLLAIALSTIYVAEREMDLMLDIGYERLHESLNELEGFEFGHLDAPVGAANLVPYPVSEFPEFSHLVHRMGVSGTRDRNFRPYRTVDELLRGTSNCLRMLADDAYFEEKKIELEQFIHSILNHAVLLVEDCSFSGKRLGKTLDRFTKLLDLLFSPHLSALRDKGHRPPTLLLLVICGTSAAKKALRHLGNGWIRYASIFGGLFDDDNRSAERVPHNVRELCGITGFDEVSLHSKLAIAVDWFWDTHGKNYNIKTQVGSTADFDVEELRWGYGGKRAGGWTIVRHHNCPNNSLMPLWYPTVGMEYEGIVPLFSRNESHLDHSESATLSFEEAMGTAKADSYGHLSRALKSIFADLS